MRIGVRVRVWLWRLQALHALALTDVALCTPAEDPARIVRCLAPYLKFAPAGAAAGREAAERRDAECLLCILVSALYSHAQYPGRSLHACSPTVVKAAPSAASCAT